MMLEEIFDLLDIESADEFEYFEQLAEVIEHENDISYDAFYSLFKDVSPEIVADLLDSYFEDLMLGIPDEATDFYTLITMIHQMLTGLCQGAEDDKLKRSLIEELFRFRDWYVFDSSVNCRNTNNKQLSQIPLIEALSLYRMEKLGECKYDYDFTDCLDYTIEEYIVPLSSISDSYDEE